VVTEAQLVDAADRLERRLGIDALWLFGSESAGRARRDSDVDLAALFRRRPSAPGLLDAAAELSLGLGREVDLVDFESAPPVLAVQVLRHGRLLVDRAPHRRHRSVIRAISEYHDLKVLRRAGERALVLRMAGGRS
jgi:predicted nucleotidyltransferase